MARTRADVREAELLEDLADRALVVSEAEALGHDLLQVHPAPAHDSMNGALRAGFNDLRQLRQLLRREARRVAFRPAVLEPFGAPFIEAVDPVPQRLAVHATDPRGIGPAHPIQQRRKRQQTPTLVGVLAGRRKTPQLVGRKVRPHRHRCRHGTNPPAPWNQLTTEREIASESERKAGGIRSVSSLLIPLVAWTAGCASAAAVPEPPRRPVDLNQKTTAAPAASKQIAPPETPVPDEALSATSKCLAQPQRLGLRVEPGLVAAEKNE